MHDPKLFKPWEQWYFSVRIQVMQAFQYLQWYYFTSFKENSEDLFVMGMESKTSCESHGNSHMGTSMETGSTKGVV